MEKKTKLFLASAFALASVSFVFSAASAQEAVAAKPEKAAETQDARRGNASAKPDDAANTVLSAETTAANADDTQKPKDKAKEDKPKKNKDEFNGQEHRSSVAVFVQSLLAVADREGGIGQEVRVIAQQQNESKDRAADLINAVQNRSKLKTFFIGTSYRNLGELRSQMVQTRNQLEQLKRLADKAENEQDKAELQTQIKALEQQQADVDKFIVQNESKFSLFGWAVKLFRK